MQFDEGSIVKEVAGWIGAALAGLVGLVVKSTHGRIRKLERDSVTRQELEAYVERADTSRAELRDSIIKLFDKLDELKTILLKRNIDD